MTKPSVRPRSSQDGNRTGCPELAAVLAQVPAFDLHAAVHLCPGQIALRPSRLAVLCKMQHTQMLAQDFFLRIAQNAFRSRRPYRKASFAIQHENSVFLYSGKNEVMPFHLHVKLRVNHRQFLVGVLEGRVEADRFPVRRPQLLIARLEFVDRALQLFPCQFPPADRSLLDERSPGRFGFAIAFAESLHGAARRSPLLAGGMTSYRPGFSVVESKDFIDGFQRKRRGGSGRTPLPAAITTDRDRWAAQLSLLREPR